MLINDLKYFEYMAGLKTQYYALDRPTFRLPQEPEDWFDNYPYGDDIYNPALEELLDWILERDQSQILSISSEIVAQ